MFYWQAEGHQKRCSGFHSNPGDARGRGKGKGREIKKKQTQKSAAINQTRKKREKNKRMGSPKRKRKKLRQKREQSAYRDNDRTQRGEKRRQNKKSPSIEGRDRLSGGRIKGGPKNSGKSSTGGRVDPIQPSSSRTIQLKKEKEKEKKGGARHSRKERLTINKKVTKKLEKTKNTSQSKIKHEMK